MTTFEPPGLIGWWPLHDVESRLTDRLGQSGGVVAGAVPHTQPPSDRLEPSRSLYFARGTYAAIPNAPNVETGDFSVCLWAKMSGYSGATEVLLDKRIENSGPVRGWCIFLYGGQLGFQISDGNWLNLLLDSSQQPIDGNWHHLAITIDRDQATGGRWYVDGQAVGSPFSVTHRAGSLSNQMPLTLGRRSDAGGGDFQGELSDVRLYQRLLTAEEIYQVYVSIAADEPASRILVTPPPVVSPVALQVENGERPPWTDEVPLIEITPELAIEVQPQPSPAIDDNWTTSEKQAYEQTRQAILDCSRTGSILDLYNFSLRMLPPEIGQLQNLQKINVCNTPLTQLPPEIGQLQNLQQLTLSDTRLTHLPTEIGQLQNLQKLNLYRTDLTHLPPEIGQLQNLQELNLRFTRLTHLPPEIGQLQNLQKLDLYRTDLTHLPPEIGQLQNLQELDLSRTRLTQLPPEIGQLQNLQQLDLTDISLTQLPPEIGQLQNLQQLDLTDISLTQLLPEIGQLQKLQKLNLRFTRLTHLPPEIGQLQKLQKLNLSCTRLTQLPPEIGQLHNLQELVLHSTALTQLPPEIGQLHNLQKLYLQNTALTQLPPEIGQLYNLQTLNLYQTHLTQLPPEFGQLQNLQTLNLYQTHLTQLPPEVGQLQKLQNLDLRGTHLTQLPPEIGQLHNLQNLDLHSTHLTQLPPEIGQLHNLQNLDLHSTHLTQLPPEFGQLHNLQTLDLEGTPIQDLSPLVNHPNPALEVRCWGFRSLPRQYWVHPSQWKAEWLLTESNPEICRILMARIGDNRIYQKLQATEVQPSPAIDDDWTTSEKLVYEKARQAILSCSRTGSTLNLRSSELRMLPPEIGQLHNLQSLNLQGAPLTQLPPEIGQLQNLQTLDLHDTRLTQLPPEIGQLQNLQTLNLSDIHLTQLPPEIGQLQNLQTLDLEGTSNQDLSPLVNHPNPALEVRGCWGFRGIVPRKYWVHPPSQWKAEWLLTEHNAEFRRIAIAGIGYDRICQELQATELDAWREYTLLKIDATYVDVEAIHLLKMTCPSTAHIHALRVPPTLTSARAAIRWANWDIDSEAFALET